MSSVSSSASSALGSPEAIRAHGDSGHSDVEQDDNESEVLDAVAKNQHDIFGSDIDSSSDGERYVHRTKQRHPISSDGTDESLQQSTTDDNKSDAAEPNTSKESKEISARALLGSSSSNDSEVEQSPNIQNKRKEQSHSPASSHASSEESMLGSNTIKQISNEDDEENSGGDDAEEEHPEETEEPDETSIAVDFPHIRADLGREMHMVKMPNFLSVETRPFDPSVYEDELDEDDVLDEEGRTRLKLKVENTIRWRAVKNENGEPVHESNARIVKWSDGSLSLYLGDEIFDVHRMDIQSDYNHLFIREGNGLQGQAVFKTKLTFRPHSTDSFTHRKITLSLADKTSKSQKVKILPVAGQDPESNRHLLVRKEEEKLRASLRRESQQRRMRERQLASQAHRNRRLSGNAGGYDLDEEEDDSLDEGNSISLAALKRDAKAGFNAKRKAGTSGPYSDDDSVSDVSEVHVRKKARISDEEDEESD